MRLPSNHMHDLESGGYSSILMTVQLCSKTLVSESEERRKARTRTSIDGSGGEEGIRVELWSAIDYSIALPHPFEVLDQFKHRGVGDLNLVDVYGGEVEARAVEEGGDGL